MIILEGHYFDGVTSKKRRASLAIHDDGEVRLTVDRGVRAFRFRDLEIAPRLGNMPRSLVFPDGGKFETGENDRVDAALTRLGGASGSRLLRLLETRLPFILAAVAIVVAAVWAFVQYGIPAAARAAAFAVPAATNATLGRGALEILDRAHLEPSALDEATRARIRDLFAGVIRDGPEGYAPRLVFRRGRTLGPNALALPSGTVILTDELVDLTEHSGELVAVLAHEVGHLVERHALRQAIQDSIVVLLVVALTGDVSSTSTLVAAVPTLLVEAQFSRAFELEADAYALAYLQRAGIDPAHFANLMRRMGDSASGGASITSFFSTHPASEERISRFTKGAQRPGQLEPRSRPRPGGSEGAARPAARLLRPQAVDAPSSCRANTHIILTSMLWRGSASGGDVVSSKEVCGHWLVRPRRESSCLMTINSSVCMRGK